MRECSHSAPLLMMVIGGLLLWHNPFPDFRLFEWISQYWPFLLIAWGLIQLAEELLPQRWNKSRP